MVSSISRKLGQADAIDETECPLCQAKMPVGEIPKHIDRQCPPVKPKSKTVHSGNQKSDWKKVFSGAGSSKTKESVTSAKSSKERQLMSRVEMKRIKKPNYNLTSPADLRTLLRVS
jgi:E3 ubiquitin-protein ligase RAD18